MSDTPPGPAEKPSPHPIFPLAGPAPVIDEEHKKKLAELNRGRATFPLPPPEKPAQP
jgi:hypothetical protein